MITNAVRCVPPENKPTSAEIGTCRPFLANRIAGMPRLAVPAGAGTDRPRQHACGAGGAPVGFPLCAWRAPRRAAKSGALRQLSLLALQHQYRQAHARNVSAPCCRRSGTIWGRPRIKARGRHLAPASATTRKAAESILRRPCGRPTRAELVCGSTGSYCAPWRLAMKARRSNRCTSCSFLSSAPCRGGISLRGSLSRSVSGDDVLVQEQLQPVEQLGCRGLLLDAGHLAHVVEDLERLRDEAGL